VLGTVDRAQTRTTQPNAGLLLATLLVFAIAGCSTSGSGPGGPQHGGSLTVDTATPPNNLDVWTTSDNESIWAYAQIGQTLYQNAADGKSVVPRLATSYSLSQDQLSWTLQLRQGVRFSTGAPMTAADVVFSITQAASSNDTGWGWLDSAIASVTAQGDNAVQITTKYPWAPLLADLAFFGNAIVPANYGGEAHEAFYKHPVGTGPFMFDQWVQGQYLRLKRNPNYWEPGKPYLDSITFQAVGDDNTRVLQLQGGQANVIENVPFGSISSLQSSSYKVGLFDSTRIDYITMNELIAPFKDIHVRRAISYAIDTKAIVSAVFFGHGQAADSPLMPSVQYYKAVGLASSDIAKARQELAQSAYPNGGITVDFITSSQDQVQYKIAQIVKADLAPLNITVNLRLLDPSEVTAQEQSFKYGMRETYWTMDIVDPDEYVSFVLDGSPAAGAFANFTHFDNSQLDQMIHQAQGVFDTNQRASLYAQVQQLAANQAPIVWVGYSPYRYGYSVKVHDYSVYPEGNTHFENVWLSP
jgi:peptide/nickel transport system substrate-binding protein